MDITSKKERIRRFFSFLFFSFLFFSFLPGRLFREWIDMLSFENNTVVRDQRNKYLNPSEKADKANINGSNDPAQPTVPRRPD